MSSDIFHHLFLTQADNHGEARQKVLHFLEHTDLIRYEATTVQEAAIINGSHPTFWTEVDQGISRNRRCAENLVTELQETGITHLTELKDLAQGYPSKVLHTLVHILDGFIGADSNFYNLLEDSHWLSAKLTELIKERPADYWLVPVVPGRLQYSVFHPTGK